MMIRKIVIILLVMMVPVLSVSADVKHFPTPGDAAKRLTSALEMRDKSALNELFTAEYRTFVSVKKIDSDDIDLFLAMYERSHKLVSFDGKEVYIEVGEHDWTFPVPLVKDSEGWSFDFDIGKENMITRQIGRNELALIEALQDEPDLETLRTSTLADVYEFIENEGDIVALPKAYGESAIRSLILTKGGVLLEADLGTDGVIEYERFENVEERYLSRP